PLRQRTLEHLAVLQIHLRVGQNLDEDERKLAMNLTPVYEQWREETLQQGRQEGIQLGLQQGERALVLRLLARRVGTMPAEVIAQVEALSLPELETLGEALLEFSTLEEVRAWLQLHPSL
ncbi:MAG: DUF4351 domain-containing protein, partial [Acaryochloris sp. RU_4_1]|nr:DUF4351 domain-containing protein [Acaryochloris sp. RU_4_1]